MPLRFRNIDASPDDPVREWGFEGILAAIDRGYAQHWSRIADAVVADPDVADVFEEAAAAAESTSTVGLLRAMIAHRQRTPEQVALDRLRDAFRSTRLTQGELASKLGTSRTRLNSYLTGAVTPSMAVLAEVERLAEYERALGNAPRLVLH